MANKKSVRTIVQDNYLRLVRQTAISEALAAGSRVGQRTVNRAKKGQNLTLDSLDGLAAHFGLQGWQLAVPAADGTDNNPPHVPFIATAAGNAQSLGMRLKARLKELSMSVQELSEAVDVSIQTLHQLIRDPQRGMHSKNAGKIAHVLKINERWLVTGEGQKEPQTVNEAEAALLDDFRCLEPKLQESICFLIKSARANS